MQGRKKGRPLYALLIEHREIPLLAVLVLLLTLVSIRVPGYLGNNYIYRSRNALYPCQHSLWSACRSYDNT